MEWQVSRSLTRRKMTIDSTSPHVKAGSIARQADSLNLLPPSWDFNLIVHPLHFNIKPS